MYVPIVQSVYDRMLQQVYNSTQFQLIAGINMGQLINQLHEDHALLSETSFLVGLSQSKLYEYYWHYKEISESFSIDSTEFVDIFSEFHPIFNVLDSNHNLLIDSLELFSAMALFSKLIGLEDKILFIFKLFDFNDLNSLSLTDLEFMLVTCVSVSWKLMGGKPQELNEQAIIAYIHQHFEVQSRTNISLFKNWALTSQAVNIFISIINNQKTGESAMNSKTVIKMQSLLSHKLYRSLQTNCRNELSSILASNSKQAAYRRLVDKQTKKWLNENRKLVDSENSNQNFSNAVSGVVSNKLSLKSEGSQLKINDISDFTLTPNWVYGVRHSDVKYFVDFVSQDELVYFVGRVVILHNFKSLKQRHYLQHEWEVICLAIDRSRVCNGSNEQIIATSEFVSSDRISQQQPSIRIWNVRSLQTIKVLRSHHKTGIHLLKFTNSGSYLVSSSLSFNAPVVVYSCKSDYNPVYCVSCLHPAVEIACVFAVVGKQSDDFVIATMYGIRYFQVPADSKSSEENKFESWELSNKQEGEQHEEGEVETEEQCSICVTRSNSFKYGNFSAITCCSFLLTNKHLIHLSGYDNQNRRLPITGHERGEVLVWSVQSNCILFKLFNEGPEIVSLIPSLSNIMIASNSSLISFWAIDLQAKKKIHEIDITTFDFEGHDDAARSVGGLNSYEIATVVQYMARPNHSNSLGSNSTQPEYVVATTRGDFFTFQLAKKQDSSLRYKLIGPRYQSRHLVSIINLPNITHHRLLEPKTGPSLLAFSTSEGILNMVSSQTRSLVSQWKIGEPIITFDLIEFRSLMEIVAATASNTLYWRSGQIQKNYKYEAQRPIKCIKIMADAGHVTVVVGLEGGHLHVVNLSEDGDKRKVSIINRVSGQSESSVSRKLLMKSDQIKILSTLPNGHHPNQSSDTYSYPKDAQKQSNSLLIKKLKLASTPTEIVGLEKKMLMISTEDNIFYLASLKDYHFNVIEPDKNPLPAYLIRNKSAKINFCVGKNHSKTGKKPVSLPALLAKGERLFILAGLDGSISVWKNLSEVVEQNKLRYNWHIGQIINFAIDNDMNKMYSSGAQDGMLIESLILKFYEPGRTIRKPCRALTSLTSIMSMSTYFNNVMRFNEPDSMLQRQIQFCLFTNEISFQTYDQHLQIRGLENETLYKLFKGMSERWLLANSDYSLQKSSPQMSLKLEHVYGIETDNKRETVLVVHRPALNFVYFVSNVVIVYDPSLNKQRVYRGHRGKITAISKIQAYDQNKGKGINCTELIVSAESAYKACIKIWHPQTLQTLKSIPTAHTLGIISIFCRSQTILSYGISLAKPNFSFSLQLSSAQSTSCDSTSIIACRILKQPVYSMSISPMNSSQFVTTGPYNVTFWQAISHNIEKISVIEMNNLVTSCIFRLIEQLDSECNEDYDSFGFNLESSSRKDKNSAGIKDCEGLRQELIVGSQNGQIGLIYDHSRYIMIEEKAHNKAINCITFISNQPTSCPNQGKLSWRNSLKNRNIRHIATCSEDETLKIWSRNFQLEFQQDMRKVQFEQRITNANQTSSNFGTAFTNAGPQQMQIGKKPGPQNSMSSSNQNNNNGGYSANGSSGSNITILLGKERVLSKNAAIQSINVIYESQSKTALTKQNSLQSTKAGSEICLLLATRNGDVLIMKDYDVINSNGNNSASNIRNDILRRQNSKIKAPKRPSLVQKVDGEEQQSEVQKVEVKRRPSSRNNSVHRGSLFKIGNNFREKRSAIQRARPKLQNHSHTHNSGTQNHLSQLSSTQLALYDQSQQQIGAKNAQLEIKPIKNVKFVLYLRGHSSQVSTSTRPEFSSVSASSGFRCSKVLISHHPSLELLATISLDQNLMFWDTQRNVLILNRMLGYLAEPTVLKFTCDGQILIVGYSDGRLLFLDAQISKVHQGKGQQKYVLPTLRILMQDKNVCPVLAIEQSENGEYLAVSYNNKMSKAGTQNSQPQSNYNSSLTSSNSSQSSHIRIFLNKSRSQQTRPHNSLPLPSKMEHNLLFENITTIPCQADSLYTTENNNRYGMAVCSMMFTKSSEGKTYLLIYEQLVNVATHNRLNFNKDGNYIIWDVNTCTMIANTDEVSGLFWKKLNVPSSIYARYQRHQSLTMVPQSPLSISEAHLNPNPNLSLPYLSSMVGLEDYLLLGSVNGDIHIAHSSCLQYSKMLTSNPKGNELFIGKTYPAHSSEVNHIEINDKKTYVYTSGLNDKSVMKWKFEGRPQDCLTNENPQPNIYKQQGRTAYQNQNRTQIKTNAMTKNEQLALQSKLNPGPEAGQKEEQEEEQVDIFKQVPTKSQMNYRRQLYFFKQKYSFNFASYLTSANQDRSKLFSQQEEKKQSRPIYLHPEVQWAHEPQSHFQHVDAQKPKSQADAHAHAKKVRNIVDFIETIKVVNIIGRSAHNNRHSLYYDAQANIVYSTGHAVVVSKKVSNCTIRPQLKSGPNNSNYQDQKCSSVKDKTLCLEHKANSWHFERSFIHMVNSGGDDPSQEISCVCMSEDGSILFTAHNGLSPCISMWQISQSLRIKSIPFRSYLHILKLRVSSNNKTALVYGVNESHVSFLYLLCLDSNEVLGIASFPYEKPWHIKDMAFYNGSTCKFVTCGIDNVYSWSLASGMLLYETVNFVTTASTNDNKHGKNSGLSKPSRDTICLCVAFLPRSQMIVTGCEDGSLVIWDENTFYRREHSDMVMVLKACHPNMLLSGGRDGSVLLWMEEHNGSGLALCSRLNLRNQSASIFKPRGTLQSFPSYSQLTREQQELTDDPRYGKKPAQEKKQVNIQIGKQSSVNQMGNTNPNIRSNPIQESIYQELCIQSIQVKKMHASDEDELLDNYAEQDNVEYDSNKREIIEKQMYSQQHTVPKRWKVLIGTISGNIYESAFWQETKNKVSFEDNYDLLDIYHDHEVPKSFFFSKNDTEVYEITSHGYFCCRHLSDSSVIFEQNFNKQTVDLIYSPNNNLFFIVFTNEICVYSMLDTKTNQQGNGSKTIPPQHLLKPLSKLQMKYITHCQITPNENALAVGLLKNSDKSINIEVYDITKPAEMKLILSLAMPPNEKIEFIDFSANNKFLMAKFQSGKTIGQQLKPLQSMKEDMFASIEWASHAQNYSARNKAVLRKVESILNSSHCPVNETSSIGAGKERLKQQQVQIVRVSEIADQVFILVDNQSNVYAFNGQIELIGQSRLKISETSLIRFSCSRKLLGIISQIDRNIVIFDISLTKILASRSLGHKQSRSSLQQP